MDKKKRTHRKPIKHRKMTAQLSLNLAHSQCTVFTNSVQTISDTVAKAYTKHRSQLKPNIFLSYYKNLLRDYFTIRACICCCCSPRFWVRSSYVLTFFFSFCPYSLSLSHSLAHTCLYVNDTGCGASVAFHIVRFVSDFAVLHVVFVYQFYHDTHYYCTKFLKHFFVSIDGCCSVALLCLPQKYYAILHTVLH